MKQGGVAMLHGVDLDSSRLIQDLGLKCKMLASATPHNNDAIR